MSRIIICVGLYCVIPSHCRPGYSSLSLNLFLSLIHSVFNGNLFCRWDLLTQGSFDIKYLSDSNFDCSACQILPDIVIMNRFGIWTRYFLIYFWVNWAHDTQPFWLVFAVVNGQFLFYQSECNRSSSTTMLSWSLFVTQIIATYRDTVFELTKYLHRLTK